MEWLDTSELPISGCADGHAPMRAAASAGCGSSSTEGAANDGLGSAPKLVRDDLPIGLVIGERLTYFAVYGKFSGKKRRQKLKEVRVANVDGRSTADGALWVDVQMWRRYPAPEGEKLVIRSNPSLVSADCLALIDSLHVPAQHMGTAVNESNKCFRAKIRLLQGANPDASDVLDVQEYAPGLINTGRNKKLLKASKARVLVELHSKGVGAAKSDPLLELIIW